MDIKLPCQYQYQKQRFFKRLMQRKATETFQCFIEESFVYSTSAMHISIIFLSHLLTKDYMKLKGHIADFELLISTDQSL